jgi:hypothetical protein
MAAMPSVELERTLVKSPPELWEELSSDQGLSRWLGEVRVSSAEPPNRLEWDSDVARGVIELEASGWGTTVRALAEPSDDGQGPGAPDGADVERRLSGLLDDLGSSSLTSG